MARYDRTYEILAQRALKRGNVDLESFVAMAEHNGMDAARVEELLLRDLDEGGPVFGQFFRSLGGAASASVASAEAQGAIAEYLAGNEKAFDGIEKLADVIDNADPAELDAISEQAGLIDFTWQATLVNTCHLCLPLHGQTQTMQTWDALGLNPETIHANEGWSSDCYCQLIPADAAADRADLIAPLLREKVSTVTGLPGSKRTQRAVSQKDIEKALAARDKAMQSIEGRRTLSLMGKVGG